MNDNVPPPSQSPKPSTPGPGDTQKIPIAALQRAFKNRIYRYLAAGGVGLGAIGGGGYNVATAQTTQQRLTTVEVKTDTLTQVVKDLKIQVDAGSVETDKRQRKVERKVDRLELLMELQLEQAKVPKSKLPPRVEEEE